MGIHPNQTGEDSSRTGFSIQYSGRSAHSCNTEQFKIWRLWSETVSPAPPPVQCPAGPASPAKLDCRLIDKQEGGQRQGRQHNLEHRSFSPGKMVIWYFFLVIQQEIFWTFLPGTILQRPGSWILFNPLHAGKHRYLTLTTNR